MFAKVFHETWADLIDDHATKIHPKNSKIIALSLTACYALTCEETGEFAGLEPRYIVGVQRG